MSADAELLRALATRPDVGRVHSVFERVVNVDIGDGRLLTLANRDADDAPDTVVVDVATWRAPHLAAGTEVDLAPDAIRLGHRIVVTLASARPWSARLPPYPDDDATVRANLPLAREHLERHGSGIGLTRSITAAVPSTLEQALVAAFQRATRELCAALARNAVPPAIDEAIGRLIGLGPGLTPAGDDFLLGLLTALNIPGSPRADLRYIGAAAVACAARRTNRISLAALHHAANGRVRDRIVHLCRTLMYDSAGTMRAALDGVLRIGASSGTDISLGLLAGFRLHLADAPLRRTLPMPERRVGDDDGY